MTRVWHGGEAGFGRPGASCLSMKRRLGMLEVLDNVGGSILQEAIGEEKGAKSRRIEWRAASSARAIRAPTRAEQQSDGPLAGDGEP